MSARLSLVLLPLVACQPQLTHRSEADRVEVISPGFAASPVVSVVDSSEPRPVGFVVEGNPGEIELDVTKLDPERVGTFDLVDARCTDCTDSTCAGGLSRTLEFELQWAEGDIDEHVVVTLQSTNFSAQEPVFFLPATSGTTVVTVPGSMQTCGSFSYYFDVELSGTVVNAARRTAFLTHTTLTGDEVGSIADADAVCQAEADAAGLTGTFKAWIGDSTTAPADRMNAAGAPWALVDGTFVSPGLNNLVNQYPQADIVLGADGNLVAPNFFSYRVAWTGFLPNKTCADWSAGAGEEGSTGFADTIALFGHPESTWQIAAYGGDHVPCDNPVSLYCFQQ